MTDDEFTAALDAVWPTLTHLQDTTPPRYYGQVSPLAYRKDTRKIEDPAALVKPEEVEAWRAADPERTVTGKTAARLCWLEMTFGRRG